MIELPNMVEPFFNVEEGLKTSLLIVYYMLKNRLYTSQIYYARIMAYKGVKR